MLATITIASQAPNWFAVWIGSSIGMVIADGLAIAVAQMLGRKLPATALRYSAASIFIVCGIFTLTKLITRA
jgi:putative Ca2+/H+ antiporter (TMEM165/GDT1 family)